MMHSLQNRLVASLTLMIVVTGVIAGAFSFIWSYDEAIEVQDSILLQVGAVVEAGRVNVQQNTDSELEPEARVFIDELADSPENAELQRLTDGLYTLKRDGVDRRLVLRTRLDGSRFLVGQPIQVRNEIAMTSALHAISPLAVLIPCLMLVVVFVTRWTLQPVSRLASQLDSGSADRFEPLSSDGTPSELHPFIDSINRLLARVQTLIDRQRRFIADAAHELRSPVTALSLQAENLDNATLTPDGRERVVSVKAGIRRTAHLLEQLLALARYDMGENPNSAVTSLDRCAKGVVADLMPQAVERNIDLGFGAVDAADVRGDPVMIAVMIRNLIDNALRHSPRDGRIDIDLNYFYGRAILTIKDTGPGVPEADIGRLFEPFERGKAHIQDGSGLGLSIVKRIVERIGGTVTLGNVSVEGHTGFCVTVDLPASAGADE